MAEPRNGSHIDHSQPWRFVSMTSVLVTLTGLFAVALVQTAAILAAGDNSSTVGVAAAWGGILIEIAGALTVVIVGIALPFRSARVTWTLVGTALLFAGVWDTDWTYHLGDTLAAASPVEIRGLQIVLLLTFLLSSGGILSYVWRYRSRVDMFTCAVQTLGIGAIVGVLVWFLGVQPGLAGDRLPSDESFGYLAVALGGVVFSFLPVLFANIVLFHVPDSKGGRPDGLRMQPWTGALIGVALTTASSLGWYYRLAVAPWAPGLLLDFFYDLGFVVVAMAALLERDREHTLMRFEAVDGVVPPDVE